ncbi:MAG TPA: cation diffusion facilitator family transporter [Jatrophihabitans sp.]|jgi:cation diffusion facilitator family transporter
MTTVPDDRDSGPPTKDGGGDESTVTVLLALGANLAVGVLKLIAGLISGSGALLSEAAHSVGDSTTEVLLLVALRRSDRPADRRHPFGYGKERYFWSLLAAGAIFVSGAAFSIYEGLHTIFSSGGAESTDKLWINYPVLVVAACFEGASFFQAIRRARTQARESRKTLRGLLRDPEDPTVNSVAMEDSAALVGILIAIIGVSLHQLTGDAVYDGIASLLIGALLLVVAFLLARATGDLLIGKQASTRLLDAIETFLENEAEILDVVDVLSMLVGTGSVLLCVRADFHDEVSSGDIEEACMRIDIDLRERFPELSEVFIQPVSRGDPRVEERVEARYGRTLSDH